MLSTKTILAVISVTSMMSSLAMAQLTPGPSHGSGGGNPPPHYNPCSVPNDPACGHGGGHGNPGHNPGNPGHNPGHDHDHDHGGYPGNPPLTPGPSHPGYPTEPSYPNYPTYPTYPSQPNFPVSPYYPQDPGYYPDDNTIVRRVTLNRSINNQAIDLRRLFNLDNNYTGYRVVSVSASTTPNSPATTIANLVVNGYVMAREVNPGYEISLYPQERVRLDNSGTSVLLGVQGSTYINDLQIELSRY